ncbi:hypothetical protein AAG906_026261 [Vitis piasezkii]
MGGGNKVSRDHDAPRMGSSKMPNVRERMVNTKPNTPKTSLLSRVQVKQAKGERAEVARTHIDKVTKEKVKSMGKRKQYSKHQKCRDLHPSKASRKK